MNYLKGMQYISCYLHLTLHELLLILYGQHELLEGMQCMITKLHLAMHESLLILYGQHELFGRHAIHN